MIQSVLVPHLHRPTHTLTHKQHYERKSHFSQQAHVALRHEGRNIFSFNDFTVGTWSEGFLLTAKFNSEYGNVVTTVFLVWCLARLLKAQEIHFKAGAGRAPQIRVAYLSPSASSFI